MLITVDVKYILSVESIELFWDTGFEKLIEYF
jgi:hypothetical protein